MIITKKQLDKFEEIRESGITNMMDYKRVSQESDGILSGKDVIEIISNYEELTKK